MANNAGYDDVLLAKNRIADFAVRTPFVESPELGERINGKVFLKLELFQRTGSFKSGWRAQSPGDDPGK